MSSRKAATAECSCRRGRQEIAFIYKAVATGWEVALL